VIGTLEGKSVVCQQGRAHYYEGYSAEEVSYPIRVMRDHINFVGMAGAHALRGPNDDSLGPRFVGMSMAYDRSLRDLAKAVAQRGNIPMHEGVYTCLSGPTFETPAVHEVVVARHMGLRVLAFSAITNKSIDVIDSETDANHEEVLETGKIIVPKLKAIIRGVVAAL
jgi:purine-nucleoside phosphorylase